MDTYWDLSPKTRSALTREEVERYGEFELMVKGVLKPAPPAVESVPMPELLKHRFYRVKGTDLLFKNQEDADRLRDIPELFTQATDYRLGYTKNEIAKPLEDFTVESVALPMDPEISRQISALNAFNASKTRRESDARKFQEANDKADAALKSMWDDWAHQREQAEIVRRVLETRNKYLKMTNGDPALAESFLVEAFGSSDVTFAMEWEAEGGE